MMMTLLKTKRIWLAVSLALFLLLFFIFRTEPAFSGFLVNYIGVPYKTAVGWVASFLPFSLAEVVMAVVVGGALIYIIQTVYLLIKGNSARLKLLSNRLLNLVISVLIIATLMSVVWGANYYIESPVSAIATANPVSVQQLEEATRLFAQKLNGTAPLVERDENGVFAVSKEEIFTLGENLYDNLEAEYPSLVGAKHSAKPLVISPFMSELNYTGFFFPLTGEANVNDEQPASTLPSTIAHELAHLRGVAPEQDCNFLAVLACDFSDIAVYEYSGFMLAYVNLANNLYGADYDAWLEITEDLHPYVLADIRYNNDYWAQFEGVAAEVADTLYEGFLQGNGQSEGLKSYGMVTDLLIDYYL